MWHKLTNDELRQAISKIVNRCTTAEEVNAMAKKELDYPYHIGVVYGHPGAIFRVRNQQNPPDFLYHEA